MRLCGHGPPPPSSHSPVYAGSQSGSFYALSRSAGSPLWIHAVTMGVTSSAAVARDAAGTVVYVGLGVSLQALNATSGLILWTFPTQDWVVSSPLLLPGGTLYVGSNDGSVYAVSAASGQQVWSYTTGGPVGGSVAVSEGVAVFGSSDQNVYGVDAANGTLLWKFATAAAVQSTAALGNGTAYIGSEVGERVCEGGCVLGWGALRFSLLWIHVCVYDSRVCLPISQCLCVCVAGRQRIRAEPAHRRAGVALHHRQRRVL